MTLLIHPAYESQFGRQLWQRAILTATLLVLLEVELTEGWHVVHILEVLGALVFFSLSWRTWRAKNS